MTPWCDLPQITLAFEFRTYSLSLGISRVFQEQISQITRMSRAKDDMDLPVRIRLHDRMGNYDFMGVICPVNFQESGYSVHAPPFPPEGVLNAISLPISTLIAIF
jgi:hypothetical protein